MKRNPTTPRLRLPLSSTPALCHRVSPMDAGGAKKMLLSASYRAKLFLHGESALELSGAFKGASEEYDTNRQAFNALMVRARNGNEEAQQELQAIQVVTIDNFLKVQALWGQFFMQGTLGEAENVFFENVEHREVNFMAAAQDGGLPLWQNARARSKTMVPYYGITSEEFEYVLRDWYAGAVADRAKAGLDVAGDLALKLDTKFQELVAAGIGAFALTGDKWDRVYLPHSRFNSDNLPTTNLITQSSLTTSSLLTVEGLKLIIKYCKSWGENAFGDGPLTPAAVFIPSSLFTGFLDQVEVDDPENAINAQIFDFGTVVNYGGYNWTFIADPTLRPNDGLAYVRFNKPYGYHWSKPSENSMIIDNSVAKRKNNLESMSETSVFATYAPAQRRVNVAAIRFRTAS